MSCKPILDVHRLAHLCSKSDLKASDGRPKPRAFRMRKTETDLSFNWFEYFTEKGMSYEEALQRIREDAARPLESTDRYAVVSAAKIKLAIQFSMAMFQQEPRAPLIEHTPESGNESHASVLGDGYDLRGVDFKATLAQLVFAEDMELALPD